MGEDRGQALHRRNGQGAVNAGVAIAEVVCALALGLGFSGVVHAGDKEMCEKYKARLKKYETEGVMGINPSTGEKRKMEGEAAKDAIDDTKENIKVFCK